MTTAHEFLMALTVVLCVAGVITVLFRRLRQPVVLGYILAGLVIGPHVPLPGVASPEVIHTFSELGVILLMFGLGLEFSIGTLLRAAPKAGITAVLECSLMMALGYLVTRLLGWTPMESLFAAALVAISSTTIIAKAFAEQKITGTLHELVVAILIVEDLIAVLLIAILTAVSTGTGVSAGEVFETIARLGIFLVALVAGGLLVVPRVIRYVVDGGRAETTVVVAIGTCFGVAVLAKAAGFSVALGGFFAGMLVAESGKSAEIERVIHPVRDIFAAVFFVAVGMMIDPAQVMEHWLAIVVLALTVVVGKILGVSVGAFMTGRGTRTSIAAGMSMAQIGEFSFIIASVGVSLGVIGTYVYPVAVSVSALTALLTPALIRRSDAVAHFVDRKLPKRLQTFVALYESWLARLASSRRVSQSQFRRFARRMLLDVIAIAAIAIALSLSFETVVVWLRDVGVAQRAVRLIVVVTGGALAAPFCISLLRTTFRFARLVSEAAMPRGPGGELDLGHQPRTVLEAAIRLVGVLLVGTALVAITQPFVPGYTAVIVVAIAVIVLGVLFWRRAGNLQGHVRAAAQAVIEALAGQARARDRSGREVDPFEHARGLFPGIGAPVRFEVPRHSPVVGHSLAEIALRARTGATVLALVRGTQGRVPDSHEPLQAGDTVAIAGTDAAIAAAIAVLELGAMPADACA